MTEAAKNRVVVGVDGSEASLAALVWATEEAAGLGAEVEAVTVWTHDAMLDDASAERTLAEARNVHLHDLEAQVTVALKGRSNVTVRCSAPDGDATDILVERSRDARMLVVGSHGAGKLHDILVGSVSSACLRHAYCPVVVIPPGARTPESRIGRLLAETS
ncbi:MAG TPA: universal stress protein [Amycolatopsis sp.]|nr:universal stress protein [Amycolatopsis sp.]